MDAPPPAPRPGSAAAVELALVRRALAGDGEAKAEVERVLATIPRIVTSLLRSAGSWVAAQDLDDVVQDCSTLAWRKLPDFEGRARLSTWLYRVVSLELKNALRRVAKRRRSGPPDPARAGPEPGSLKEDPKRLLLPWAVEECLAKLDPTPREIVRLRHWEGRQFDEIAATLAIHVSQAKSLYYRALVRLEELLDAGDEGTDG